MIEFIKSFIAVTQTNDRPTLNRYLLICAGTVLVLIGAGFNGYTVTWFQSADGVISDLTRIEVWFFGVGLAVCGAVLTTQRSIYSTATIICTSVYVVIIGGVLHFLEGYTLATSTSALGSDDAYISFRYAQNLAEGIGLVFNAGDRVEGYTNLLYVLIISPIFFFDNDFVYLYSFILNLIFYIVSLFIFYCFAKRQYGEISSAAAALLFAFQPILWLWSASGMETSLVVLLQVAVWVLAERYHQDENPKHLYGLLACVVLCMLVRADGFITPLVAILFFLTKGKYRTAAAIGLCVFALVTVLTLWRIQYYGFPLPNTFYAKVHGELHIRLLLGLKELWGVITKPGIGAFIVICAVAATTNIINSVTNLNIKSIQFGTIFTSIWLGYYVMVGGDHFEERFLIAFVPLGIYAVLPMLRNQIFTQHSLFVLCLLVVVQTSPLVADRRFSYAGQKYDSWITLGKFLKENHDGKYLASGAAGKLPFYSGLKTLDMLGLNDPVIAHSEGELNLNTEPGHGKTNSAYVLARSPDLIAGWLADEISLDLWSGISERDYVRHGYKIKYMLNVSYKSLGENILHVEGKDKAFILRMRSRGYSWVVLSRN